MSDYVHSPTTRTVLRSLVPVICPPEAAALADAIVEHMELSFRATPALVRRGLAAGLVTYELGALPRYGRRASKLTGARAEAYFRSWEHGITPLHVQFARGLNQLMSLSCYELAPMMERVGYRVAPWIAEVTKKRLTVYADDVKAQERQILAPDPLRPVSSRQKESA